MRIGLKKRSTICTAATLALMLAFAPAAFAAETSGDPPKLTDTRIQNAVERELWVDTGVPAHRVDLNVIEGVATLSGSVDNILAKDRATEIASATKGVRSVVNRIKVRPVDRTDSQIRMEIEDALVGDAATDSFEVDATVVDGIVTLTGAVDSWAERELALDAAKGVRGVRNVINSIDVEADYNRSDLEIKNDIEGRLQNDVRVDSALIDVIVDDGAVTLEGSVGSAAEKDTAETIAWTIGAKSVDSDNLEVQWWARDEMKRRETFVDRSDEEIEEAIEDAWFYDPRVSSFDLNASVNNGKATLTGDVDNLSAKWTAAEDARNTHGVWKVTNLIRVRTTELRTDEEVSEDVEAALLRDPYVERFELEVDTINGRVYLDGEVDSEFERNRAETVAGTVLGVFDVVNNISIEEPVTPLISDLEIQDEIQDELFWSPFVDSDRVTVVVDDGVATLTGTVDSWKEFQKATENAYEGGAVLVDNDLEIDFGDES